MLMEAERNFQDAGCVKGEYTDKGGSTWHLDAEDLGSGPDSAPKANITL